MKEKKIQASLEVAKIVDKKDEQVLIEPSFKIDTILSTENRLELKFQIPTNHSDENREFNLRLESSSGTVEVLPFEIEDNLAERATHDTGGMIICFNNEPKLILVAGEYPLREHPGSGFLKMVTHIDLVKVNPEDQKIEVIPQLERHNGEPYVLENDYPDKRGLLIMRNNLSILEHNGNVLINRGES